MADNLLKTFNKIMSSTEKPTQASAFNPDEIVMTDAERNTAAILALEGIETKKYNVYLTRLFLEGKITSDEAALAAVEYGKSGRLLY